MRWGHDFPKDKGVGMLTLIQFGENPCVMGRTHQNCQLPSFFSSLPNHLFCQKVVEVVISWKGRVWEISNWAEHPVLECRVVIAWTRKHHDRMPVWTHVFTFWFYSHVLRAAKSLGSLSYSPPSLFPKRVTLW